MAEEAASQEQFRRDRAVMHRVSTVIIAQDEAARIAACVDAVRPFSDEVLVLDGGSSDDTAEMARRLGCRVIESPWPGYARQRNRGAAAARHDWIFFVDADERVGPRLAAEVQRWKERAEGQPHALAVVRIGDFMGVWLTNRPERTVRLYDRRHCELDDVQVHERVVFRSRAGEVAELDGTLWHYGYRSLHDHIARYNHYTSLEAEKARTAGRAFSRRRLLWRPPARFAQRFLVQGGARMGAPGLVDSVLWSYYEVMRELKLLERFERDAPPPLEQSHSGNGGGHRRKARRAAV